MTPHPLHLPVAACKHSDREAKLIPIRSLPITDVEKTIVLSDATAIADRIRHGEYTAVQVITAFLKAAVAAQDRTNCLTEICDEDALARAKELDEHFSKTGNVVGPLHGVPVSIKDHVKVKGLDTSTGYTGV